MRRLKKSIYRHSLLAVATLLLILSLNQKQILSLPAPPTSPPILHSRQDPPAPLQLVQQGRSLYQSGQFTQAIARWRQAIGYYQAKNDVLNRALTLTYVSLAYQQLGNWTEATTAIHTSLSLISPSSSPLILAQALNAQGSLQFAQGQLEAALATWKQATDRYTQAGETYRTIGSLINQAQAQQALGLFLQARKSLNLVEQRLQQQPDSPLKALGLRSLGNTLLLVGNGDDAQRAFDQSLKITTDLQLPQEASSVLLSLGNLARSQNNFTLALERYRQAVIQADPMTQIQAQLNQLSLLLDRQAQSQAQSLAAIVQSLLDQQPISRTRLYAEMNFAQSLVKLGNRAQAARRLASAQQQARKLGDRRAEAYIIGYLGKVYEQTQQWTEAQQLTEQALLLAQSLDAADIAYQWQWQLGRIHLAEGQLSTAIAAYATAFQTLQSLRTDLVATSPDLQFSFRESVEPVYREYVDALLRTSNPDQASLQQARQVIESLQVAELNNFLRTACLDGQIVAIDSLQQTDAAILYPIILKDRLELILSLPGQSLRRYTTIIPQQVVETTLEQLRQALEQPITTPESKQLGQQVYTWLIQPIAADLSAQSLKTLVFVLDGSLRNVPMAALYDGNNYLIQRYSIALAPGLQLTNPQPLQQKVLRTIAAGLTEARHGFTALANVNAEIQEIQTVLSSQVLLDQGFTSAALQAQIQALPYPIVHLATHGQFSSNAAETFILAWDKPIPVNELGALLRDRTDSQKQAIELLVLSACETAAGDQRAALGLAGLAVQAGARSTLASLWSLDDESGAKLMGQFYRELTKANTSRGEALQRAQLALLQDPDFRHPRYWAPYVLVGNWL